jgi:hypothetical protein
LGCRWEKAILHFAKVGDQLDGPPPTVVGAGLYRSGCHYLYNVRDDHDMSLSETIHHSPPTVVTGVGALGLRFDLRGASLGDGRE